VRRYADKQARSLEFRRSPPPPDKRALRVGYPERFPVLHHSVELGAMAVRGAGLDLSSPQKRSSVDLPLGGPMAVSSDAAWLRSPSYVQGLHLDDTATLLAQAELCTGGRRTESERSSTHVIHMSMPNAMRLSQVRRCHPHQRGVGLVVGSGGTACRSRLSVVSGSREGKQELRLRLGFCAPSRRERSAHSDEALQAVLAALSAALIALVGW
jgi:hypothetical protein